MLSSTSIHGLAVIALAAALIFHCAPSFAGEPAGQKEAQAAPAEEMDQEEALREAEAPVAAAPEAAEKQPGAPVAEKEKTLITAGTLTRYEKDKTTVGAGDAIVKYGRKIVAGDMVIYNEETGEGEVEGAVWFTDGRSDIQADRVEFNSFSELGSLYGARGSFEGYYSFEGGKIDRLAEDHYHIVDGSVTTCALDHPHWRLDAADADVTMEDYAYIKHMVFRAGGVPIFYIPYFVASTKTQRSTGFLTPSLSYSDQQGMRFTNYFFWAIADNMDATVTHEYMGSAGNRYGGEFRYILSPGVYGTANAELLKETDPEKPNDRDLWKVRYDHRHALPWGISNVIHLDMESEESIDREYGDDVASRTRRYTDSFATLTRSWSTRNMYFIVREQKSTLPEREDTVRRLPSISFANQMEKLWNTPFYGSLQSSYIAYRISTVVDDKTYPYDVDRMDFYPSVSLPVAIAPWLGLSVTASFRSTWYSNGVDDTGQISNESFSREFYNTSVALAGPKFFRIFDTPSETMPRLKHLITPWITWNYLPGYEFDGDDRRKVRALDDIDSSGAPYNVVVFQLSNQLFAKEVLSPESSQTIQMARLNISQAYDLREASRTENPEVDKRPLSTLNFDLDTRLFKWLMVNYETKYDIYEYVWPESRLEVGFRIGDALHLALDRTYTRGPENGDDVVWDTAYAEVNTPWKISLDYSVIYDEVKSETADNVLRIRYRDDCYGMALNWYQRKINKTDPAGKPVVENETKIMFTLELKGVGDVMGGERRALAGRKI